MLFKLMQRKHEKSKHYVTGVSKAFVYKAEHNGHVLETTKKEDIAILKKAKRVEEIKKETASK